MNKFVIFAFVALVVVLLAAQADADKHKIIKKIVLKKVFKHLKKAKFIPIVVPFHLSKHQNSGWEEQGGWDQGGHEKYHVQEVGGGGHGGWEQGGW